MHPEVRRADSAERHDVSHNSTLRSSRRGFLRWRRGRCGKKQYAITLNAVLSPFCACPKLQERGHQYGFPLSHVTKSGIEKRMFNTRRCIPDLSPESPYLLSDRELSQRRFKGGKTWKREVYMEFCTTHSRAGKSHEVRTVRPIPALVHYLSLTFLLPSSTWYSPDSTLLTYASMLHGSRKKLSRALTPFPSTEKL